MNIEFEQNFHQVGQGLFYSSSTKIENMNINIIFDCGSNNSNLIEKKVHEFTHKTIDILIISHLHWDHVSGLEHLLKGRKINTVVLPYLFPEERILLQLLNYESPDWYKEFLLNPYSYLSEKNNIEKVLIINGDNETKEHHINIPDKPNDIYEEEKIKNQLKENTEENISKIEELEKTRFDNKISIFKDEGLISVSNIFLVFFNYKIKNNKKFVNFKNQINKLGLSNKGSLLLELSKLDKNDNKENLYKSYEMIYKDLNITSLAVFHGLIIPDENKTQVLKFENLAFSPLQWLIFPGYTCYKEHIVEINLVDSILESELYPLRRDKSYLYNIVGTLLLGDVKLDYKIKKKDLFNHFKDLLKYLNIIQLSHHGAINGWADELTQLINENCVYVASYGESNKYNHPNKKILIKLIENNRRIISVTENTTKMNNFYLKIKS